jgi:hypothetical protein
MGLRDLLARLTKARDESTLERAEEESHMTPSERDLDREDFEARKDDTRVAGSWEGSEAIDAAGDDAPQD